MKFRLTTISLVIGLAATSCNETQNQEQVSILDLIVTPEEYMGRQIVTEGFLNVGKIPRLFVSRDDSMYLNKANSVKLSESDFDGLKPCDQSYVQISGRFNQELALESVQYIYTKELSSTLLNPCWNKLKKKGAISNETRK